MSSEISQRDEWVRLRLDADGVIQEAFGDTRALFGRTCDELPQRHCLDLVASGSRSALLNLLKEQSNQPRLGRFKLASPSEDLCITLWTLAPAGDGQVWCVISAPPQHSPYYLTPALAEVLDRANQVVFYCNPLGHFININPSFSRITGYDRCELESLPFIELVHPEDRLLTRSAFLSALGGGGQQAEIRVLTKDHRQHHMQITNAPLWHKEQIVGVIGIGHDVTAKRMWSAALMDAQKRLEQAQRIAGLGRWRYDFKTRKAHWSPELFSLLGVDPQDFSNDYPGFRRLLHPDDVKRVTHHHRQVLRDRQALDQEFRIVMPDGTLRWIHERGEITWDNRGRPICIEGTMQDVMAYRQAEEELNLAQSALAQMNESLFILDSKRRVLSANAAFCRLTGCARSVIQDQAPVFLLASDQDISALDSIWEHLKTIGIWQGSLQGRHMDGTPLPLHLSLSAMRDRWGRITHYIGLCRKLPNLPSLTAETAEAPQHHATAQALPTRISLMRQLTVSVPAAARKDDHLALLWLDLDHFRSINESLDPAVGDIILQEVARRFQALVGGQSTLFHLGGDVFAILVEGAGATAQAITLAESLLEELNRPLPVAGMLLGLSASIGIAGLGNSEHADSASLVRQAETAMYQAKRHRHCYQLATHSRQAISPSPMGAHELRQALQNDELFMVYQPIYANQGGNRDQITGVEALVRWAHPSRGTLPPDSFLPLAERIGLLPSLGQRVLDLALQQLAKWSRNSTRPLRMAVNVAPSQLVNPQLPTQIAATLRHYHVPADALILEITENALMMHPERALEILRSLQRIGVKVAIDDFGMGYSSFNYLKQYPFDILKIDRSFTAALPSSEQDVAIVEAIMGMSRRLKLNVIAEGVETEDQWTFLTDRGCQELQGFWLSRPLSGEALDHLLR